MTSIQSQQTSKTDDHAKATRRAGTSQRSAAPDAAAVFSGMVAASQRRLSADALRAQRLAAMADADAGQKSSANCLESYIDDNIGNDDAGASASQGAPSAQAGGAEGQAGQGAGAAVAMPFSAQIQTMPEESADWLSLASLLPAGQDDGVFEVIMPNRAKVGVAVSDLPAGVSYLLMPEDDELASRLRGHEMELEAYLRRRIRRNVRVAVL
jgi:hypothetical protein